MRTKVRTPRVQVKRGASLRWFGTLGILTGLLTLYSIGVVLPAEAARSYGPPSPSLGILDTIEYSARLLWHDGLLTTPRDRSGAEHSFQIGAGESVASISRRLQDMGFILSAQALYDYLIYTGQDTTIQAGTYTLSAALSAVDIARELQDATPEDVTFVILAGWRMEEIAAAIPTSGFSFTAEQFLEAARGRPTNLEYVPAAATSEGFLFPDAYVLARSTTAAQLIEALTRNFDLHLTLELRGGFTSEGLDVFQAATLASLVEREAVQEEEQALIASVFLNRLRGGLKLDSDPTVQYALGFDAVKQTWWTNPLTAADLHHDSPFNTYLHAGLPPGPIANPGASALRAVAFPVESSYYYFRARCDDSGYHLFATTFEEHLENACP